MWVEIVVVMNSCWRLRFEVLGVVTPVRIESPEHRLRHDKYGEQRA